MYLLQLGWRQASSCRNCATRGAFLVPLGTIVPLVHRCPWSALGTWAGLSVGGATVLGAMATSASHIAVPPAIRAAPREANPAYSIVAALGIALPVDLVVGIPSTTRSRPCFARDGPTRHASGALCHTSSRVERGIRPELEIAEC